MVYSKTTPSDCNLSVKRNEIKKKRSEEETEVMERANRWQAVRTLGFSFHFGIISQCDGEAGVHRPSEGTN